MGRSTRFEPTSGSCCGIKMQQLRTERLLDLVSLGCQKVWLSRIFRTLRGKDFLMFGASQWTLMFENTVLTW